MNESERVYGRVMDVVKPTMKSYEIAITTAIGIRNCQSVVVKDRETANKCIAFLIMPDGLVLE